MTGVDCQRAELLVDILNDAFTPGHPLLYLPRDDFQHARTVTPRSDQRVTFTGRDVSEIALGACVMAFPAATTEEVWNLGAELSAIRVVSFALASLFFLCLLILLLHHGKIQGSDPKVFFQRVMSTYGITLLISAALLVGVDRIDLLSEPLVSLKRIILVAFPASFAATVVDGLR